MRIGVNDFTNILIQNIKDFVVRMNSLTGTDRLSADAIQPGSTNTVLTVDEKARLGAIEIEDSLEYKTATATATDLSSGTKITIAVPTNCTIISVSMNVETAITISGGTAYTAKYHDGSDVKTIASGITDLAKNSKVSRAMGVATDNTTDIDLSPDSGNFTAGSVKATVVYLSPIDLEDAV